MGVVGAHKRDETARNTGSESVVGSGNYGAQRGLVGSEGLVGFSPNGRTHISAPKIGGSSVGVGSSLRGKIVGAKESL